MKVQHSKAITANDYYAPWGYATSSVFSEKLLEAASRRRALHAAAGEASASATASEQPPLDMQQLMYEGASGTADSKLVPNQRCGRHQPRRLNSTSYYVPADEADKVQADA
eukprot:scaffold318038_cov33-Prasinocladus_malaysianus.AAC.2